MELELVLHDDDARILKEALGQYLSELKTEIGKTENYSWRQDLKRDEATVIAMLGRLNQTIDDKETPAPAERVGSQISG